MYLPAIRAAKDWGQRPTAVIMRDHYYGFRNMLTGQSEQEPVMNDWDFALAEALQVIEDYTNQHGILAWEAESERVEISAVKKIDRFEAIKQRVTSGKRYKSTPGEYFIPDLKLVGGEWPTMAEYVREQIAANPDTSPLEPSFTDSK